MKTKNVLLIVLVGTLSALTVNVCWRALRRPNVAVQEPVAPPGKQDKKMEGVITNSKSGPDSQEHSPENSRFEEYFKDAIAKRQSDEGKSLRLLNTLSDLLVSTYRNDPELDVLRKKVREELSRERSRLGDERFNAYLNLSDYREPTFEERTKLLEHYLRSGIKHFNETRYAQAVQTFYEFEVIVQRLGDDASLMEAIEPMLETESFYMQQARLIVAEREVKEAEERKKTSDSQSPNAPADVSIKYINEPTARRLDAIKRLDSTRKEEWLSAATILEDFIITGHADAVQSALNRLSECDSSVRFVLQKSLLLSIDESIFKDILIRAFSDPDVSNRMKYLDAIYQLTKPQLFAIQHEFPAEITISTVENVFRRKREQVTTYLKEQIDKGKVETVRLKIQTTISALE
jgi:hypothetical protein